MNTRGIHLIWTGYGTWLPGDPRGHWSPLFNLYGKLRERGHKLNVPDTVTHHRAKALMKEPRKVLSPCEIAVVARVIGAQVAPGVPGAKYPPMEGLRVHAATIEPTHVHLLIGPIGEDIAAVAGKLKSRTSSAVLAMPENAGRKRTWTAGYWKVFLFDDEALGAVRQYIAEHNARRRLAEDPYEWIG